MDNCSIKWQKARAVVVPLLLVVCKAMTLKIAKLLGDQRPKDSTTKGTKIPPAVRTKLHDENPYQPPHIQQPPLQ